jgi:isoleucyl-tRNA synthetase
MPYKDPENQKKYHRNNRARKNELHRARRAARTQEKIKADLEIKRARYAARKEKITAKERERQTGIAPELRTALKRLKRYGISQEEYAALLTRQNFVCALCKLKPPIDVDHCHDTGRVRGLLCRGCNVGLGQLGDCVEGLERGIIYLRGSGG